MTINAKLLARLLTLLLVLTLAFSLASCNVLVDANGGAGNEGGEGGTGGEEPTPAPECEHMFFEDVCIKCGDYKTITIAEALELCGEVGNITEERYYIRATVKTITNPAYGSMVIFDETGEIEVYGTYSIDGELTFDKIGETPVKGDEVLLHCILQNYNGTKEVKNARLIDFKKPEAEFDASAYTAATLAEAREADEGALLKVSGVVARITYATGYKPSGFILVDGTSSIYVYDGDAAGQVDIGNTVELAGTKAYWILGTESANAEKFGYTGSCQIDSVTVLSIDKTVTEYDKSWITETTIKDIMETPVSENITNKIFKVNALVTKAPGQGFVNYYFNDIDGYTGSYTYTQCNGGDFSWIDEFDGKICTVYIVAANAKSTATGCSFRFIPVEIIDEDYVFDVAGAAEYAVKYHGMVQFLASYTGDPALTVETSVSSALLGIENVALTYTSSDESVISFNVENGVTVMHCNGNGQVTVTVSATYAGVSYSESTTITVVPNVEVDYITVAEAIATPYDTDVVVKGIVGPSLVNKNGFYLFGEDGSMIAVIVNDVAIFDTIEIGHEIILSGMRERFVKDDSYTTYGQDSIVNGVVIANYYGNHEYSTEKFITDKTLADIEALSVNDRHTTEVYVVRVTVTVEEAQYYSNIYINQNGVKIRLYCSGANQYNWLKAYAGQEITVEVAPCNWNEKTYYTGCVLAVITEDGKVYNTYNFK